MHQEDFYEKAEKRVNDKKGFYIHLGVFVIIGLFLFALNMFTSGGTLWFHYPMLSWGIGLAIHYIVIFGIPGTDILSDEWEEEELDKEIERLKRIQGKKLLKQKLLESGVEEEDLELRELKRQTGEIFDEEDLV